MVIFACVFSNNALSTVRSVIHFVQQVARYDPRSTHARYIIYPLSGIHNFVQQVARYDARMNQPRYVINDFPRNVHFDAQMNQPRYVIHDFLVACNLLHE